MDGARLSHAYIVTGPPERAGELGLKLAQELLCERPGKGGNPCGDCRHCRKVRSGSHPDLIVLTRQNDDKGKPRREIYVEQIRELAATAAILPNEAARKVYLIRDAGSMNPAAQNALLKLLEEPPPFDAFVLVSDNAAALLETVRSRCVLRSAGEGEDAPPPEAREMAERWLDLAAAGARISLISFANEHAELGNAEMLDFVRAARGLIADMLCARLPDRKIPHRELLRLAALMDRAGEYLRFNVSTKHVLGMLSAETITGDPRGDAVRRIKH